MSCQHQRHMNTLHNKFGTKVVYTSKCFKVECVSFPTRFPISFGIHSIDVTGIMWKNVSKLTQLHFFFVKCCINGEFRFYLYIQFLEQLILKWNRVLKCIPNAIWHTSPSNEQHITTHKKSTHEPFVIKRNKT